MLIDRVAALQADLDALLSEDLVGLGRDELLAGLSGFESFKRRLPVADHALIAEVVDRGLAAEVCEPSAATLLRNVLRIGPGEATARVRAAADLGPRRSLLGEVLPPRFARVAAAGGRGHFLGSRAGDRGRGRENPHRPPTGMGSSSRS